MGKVAFTGSSNCNGVELGTGNATSEGLGLARTTGGTIL